MSIGEDRVVVHEYDSEHGLAIIPELQDKTAELIDICERLKYRDGRLAALAQTAYEQAFMWAVKAATAIPKPDPSVGVPSPSPYDVR